MSSMKGFIPVPKVVLGSTGIVTSRIGLGMAGWPERRTPNEVVDVLRTAFEIGIRHLDNAAKYNTEEIVGPALRELDVPDDVVVASKVCTYFDKDLRVSYQTFRPDVAERSVHRSLKLLGRDYLDIVYVHDLREPNIPVAFSDAGPLPVLTKLKSQGLVKAIGMATRDLPSLEAAVQSDVFDIIQTFHANTLLNRTAHETIYPLAVEKGVPVMDSGPYAGYILATGPREGAQYSYREAPQEVVEAARRLQDACARIGVELPDAAVAFSLRHPAVKTLTIGSGNPEHVKGWTRALASPLTDEQFEELVRVAGPSHPFTQSLVFDRFVDPRVSR